MLGAGFERLGRVVVFHFVMYVGWSNKNFSGVDNTRLLHMIASYVIMQLYVIMQVILSSTKRCWQANQLTPPVMKKWDSWSWLKVVCSILFKPHWANWCLCNFLNYPSSVFKKKLFLLLAKHLVVLQHCLTR